MVVGVTGASGHIGSAVCKSLLDAGYKVKGLVHNHTKSIKDLDICIEKGSILKKDSLRSFMNECDVIINSAGMIHLGYQAVKKVYDLNVIGTKNILEVAKEAGIKKIVHVGSINAFQQEPFDAELDEKRDLVTNKSLFYDQTKRDAHLLVKEAFRNGQNIVIASPTSVIGPPDYRPSKLGQAVIDIYKGTIPAVMKGGFDFADVRDVAKSIVAAIEKGRPGEVYLMSGKYYTIKELADFIMEAKGTDKRLGMVPLWMAEFGLPFIKSYSLITHRAPLYDKPYLDILRKGNKFINSAKAKKELGLSVRDLKTSVADLVNWFKEHGKL